MMIINRDKEGQEHMSEVLVARSLSVANAEKICKTLNSAEPLASSNYYVAVHDKYKLYKWEG